MAFFRFLKNPQFLIKAKSINGAKAICSLGEFRRIIEKERARANRNNHMLSLVLFDMGSPDPHNSTTIQLIEIIKGRLRCVDNAGWYDNQRIGMILPYTSIKGATQLSENICESLDKRIFEPLCTVYTYPSDQSFLNLSKVI